MRPFPPYFQVVHILMDRSLAHQGSQVAVNAKFDSFSALKHICTRAALLNVYEFVPEKVDSKRYTLKCKDKEYPCIFTQLQSLKRTHGKFVHQFKPTLIMESFTKDMPTLMKSLFRQTSSLKSILIPRLSPKPFKIISKTSTVSKISYQKAYRARERAREIIDGSHEEAYALLPQYVLQGSSMLKPWEHGSIGCGSKHKSFQTRVHLLCRKVPWDLRTIALCLVLMEPI